MSEWKLVAKLDKRTAFSGYPLEALHKVVRKLLPDAIEVQEIGVSKKTNEYLKGKLEKYVSKKYNYMSKHRQKVAVAMEMLQYSPCDVTYDEDTEEGEIKDFYIYVRKR